MTDTEKAELGCAIGSSIDEAMTGHRFGSVQEMMEVLGIALFWYMTWVFVRSEVAEGIYGKVTKV